MLDVERIGELCFVVNEWGSGTSLDIMLASNGPLSPRRGAWIVSEVADSIAAAHAHGVAHGLLVAGERPARQRRLGPDHRLLRRRGPARHAAR